MNTADTFMEPKRILYINVTRIGDTLLATPAVRAVAARWPGAEIHLLAHPKREEVVRHLPFVTHSGAITKGLAPWMGHLGARRYDIGFVCNFDKPLIAYALRVADQVVAFRQDDDAINRRLHRAVELPPPRNEHAVDTQLRLPASLGIPPAGRALAYNVARSESEWARRFLAQRKLSEARPLIGLQVASFPTKAYRDWPLPHFIELCRRLRQAWPRAHFLIFGGKLEKERTAALATELGNCATLCAGKLSLRETAALMNCTDLYVGVDTGPTHIMGALHRPLVALYHGYSPSKLLAPLEHPCLYVVDHPHAGPECTPLETMADISVDHVWQVTQRALTEHPPQ
jgi:heptosyltransferase-3